MSGESSTQEIGRILADLSAPGSFASRRTAPANALTMTVSGVGQLTFPLDPKQAKALAAAGRPARFGLREKTVLDLKVRNCAEIPLGRVKLDTERFQQTLGPMLQALGKDLGLPESTRLKADLQSMLVYGPGQFFAGHKDSEKDDAMVATLVVTLPSAFKGGDIVIEHQGKKQRFGATRANLSFLAFYADCQHEVEPVTSGYRVVLTYNLAVSPGGTTAAHAGTGPAAVRALAGELEKYFEARRPSRRPAPGVEGGEKPGRLLFLLDHEYTERGLGWGHLKGDDAPRALALREAASAAGCEATLALAEIQETWEAYEDDDSGSRWDRRWHDEDSEEDELEDEDEDEDEDEEPDSESLELGELVDSETTLDRWLEPDTGALETIQAHVQSHEIAFATPSEDLEPLKSDYEGYMGNYGNTVDRWYRRAAVLIWPRQQAWTLRASLSPGWVGRMANQALSGGRPEDASRLAEALLPSWRNLVTLDQSGKLFASTLRLAHQVCSGEVAASLLEPFGLEKLTLAHAAHVVRLVGQYGRSWWSSLVAAWTKSDRWGAREGEMEWTAHLGRFCKRLLESDGEAANLAAHELVENRWGWFRQHLESCLATETPSWRDKHLVSLAPAALGLLEAVQVTRDSELESKVSEYFRSGVESALLPLALQVLEAARKERDSGRGSSLTLAELREQAAAEIRRRLSAPPRRPDDWSIGWSTSCKCALCAKLARFLAASEARALEWPLAKEGRRHVHGAIDARELPVSHVTRRSGSPYTLVLAKTDALFKAEAATRKLLQEALARLTEPGESPRKGGRFDEKKARPEDRSLPAVPKPEAASGPKTLRAAKVAPRVRLVARAELQVRSPAASVAASGRRRRKRGS